MKKLIKKLADKFFEKDVIEVAPVKKPWRPIEDISGSRVGDAARMKVGS